jgi:hypothetical protein
MRAAPASRCRRTRSIRRSPKPRKAPSSHLQRLHLQQVSSTASTNTTLRRLKGNRALPRRSGSRDDQKRQRLLARLGVLNTPSIRQRLTPIDGDARTGAPNERNEASPLPLRSKNQHIRAEISGDFDRFNPNQGADTVNRRTSDSDTVRRQNDKTGIHGIRFVGIEIASDLIDMPGSSNCRFRRSRPGVTG